MSNEVPPGNAQPEEGSGQPPSPQPGYQDWRSARRQWREDRRERRQEWRAQRRASRSPWIGGAILILLGVIFLLASLNLLQTYNWWALFILIPAIAFFASAWGLSQAGGLRAARSALIAGIFFTLLAGVLFFGVAWEIALPAVLIAGGVALLLNALWPRQQ